MLGRGVKISLKTLASLFVDLHSALEAGLADTTLCLHNKGRGDLL
jgi:hypothetical protein